MKKRYITYIFFILAFISCKENDDIPAQPFVAAFEKLSVNFSAITSSEDVTIVFSEAASYDGQVTIQVITENTTYGTDFTTTPSAENSQLTISFSKGDESISFNFGSLIYPYEVTDNDKSVTFEIIDISYTGYHNIQGYTSAVVSFETSLGATTIAEVGGPNEGDQVFIDLSTEVVTTAQRDSWDLGFYGGSDFRVGINGSIYMAAGAIDATDIDAVTADDVATLQSQVAVGTFDPTNEAYIDSPDGLITGTAIDEISDVDSENKVYLVNMGYYIGTDEALTGSVAIAGDHRGWKKIRVLRSGEGYILQYADIDATTHQEVTIAKDSAYNFIFFSLENEMEVTVEPEKALWDLSFTVFTNVIDGAGSYGYSDFVINNIKAGVKVYEVETTDVTYADFDVAAIDESLFENDQRVIGADWRDVFSGSVYTDKYYVLKDVDGNYYKIKMLELLSESGERGYPKFEYKLIN
ncbi:hypothetical protein NBRC110019_24100 [Neptunitalea chrysea]|uniref:HmuY protein n=1 Tax=Neptunitalea chrysea TaxID=1647581 RepID=A0A9W6B8I6_9FLAO|nr:HmuY family protein [Neptunitalea chrysea]GLB53369.1 hypothetical protein NBRC110019_24100 [Neptunitalea chrysea]